MLCGVKLCSPRLQPTKCTYSSRDRRQICNLRDLVGIWQRNWRKRDDRLCGLVVRVPGYRSRGPGSIPGATRFSEK
jgi:hypothetical protein